MTESTIPNKEKIEMECRRKREIKADFEDENIIFPIQEEI